MTNKGPEHLSPKTPQNEYCLNLEAGANRLHQYLETLPPEELDEITEIEIIPRTRNYFLGIPIGKKHLEVRIKK